MVGDTIAQKQLQAKQRVERLQQEYGSEFIEFAKYAAFPLTLTTELSYCLREQFTPELPWNVAADLLLSGLFEPVGYDLYQMEANTQNYLRQELIGQWSEVNGEPKVNAIAQFLSEYILYRIGQEESSRAKNLGYPAEWIALACLKKVDALTTAIKQELAKILAQVDQPSDRFRLAAMVENQVDLLGQMGFTPIELRELEELKQQLDSNEPIRDWDVLQQAMMQSGFPELKTEEIEYQTILIDETPSKQDDGILTVFQFETVTIDQKGKETAPRSPHTAYSFIETLPQGINLAMVAIPSGEFMMGSPQTEHLHESDESPQHKVTVPPFFMGKYPITQAQWRIVAALPQEQRELTPSPSHFDGDQLPVEQVSWLNAEEFCLRLSTATGRIYRLPSEAEWEYACRAGTQTPFYFGETITGKLANYDSDYTYLQENKIKQLGKTSPVGEYPPNGFGLYDMHGNVWEWCLDHWHDKYNGAPNDGTEWLTDNDNASRLLRGGSWINYPWRCRSAYRRNDTPVNRYNNIGFRVVCEAPRTS